MYSEEPPAAISVVPMQSGQPVLRPTAFLIKMLSVASYQLFMREEPPSAISPHICKRSPHRPSQAYSASRIPLRHLSSLIHPARQGKGSIYSTCTPSFSGT